MFRKKTVFFEKLILSEMLDTLKNLFLSILNGIYIYIYLLGIKDRLSDVEVHLLMKRKHSSPHEGFKCNTQCLLRSENIKLNCLC